LGYDASAADRQHQRVLDVMGAQRALEGEVKRDSGGWMLKARLVNPASATPLWSAEKHVSNESDMPAALTALLAGLGPQLGKSAIDIGWPTAEELRALGS
jgi:hypothetical protein